MALRKVLTACAALAFVGVEAGRCRPHSSNAISSTESLTAIASSTTVSVVPSSTTQSSEASSSTVESTTTSTTSSAPTSTGYLSNPGFENNGADWTITGAGSINDFNIYHDAVGAAYLTVTETGQSAGATISTPLKNLVPGQSYQVSIYWMLNWFTNADVCSYVFSIDGQDLANAVRSTSGWVQLSQPFTAPNASPELKIQLWCSSIPPNGESDWFPLVSAYVDDVAIVEVN